MHFPGSYRTGTRVSALTQTIDLMPTFLDFHGCTPPPHVYGHSLREAALGDSAREDAIFGYFGKAMNITDGRCVYMRNPVNRDAGPLFEYTAMPVAGLDKWYPRELYPKIKTGRYFAHTYNLPLYKIPAQGQTPQPAPGAESYVGRHMLYDIEADPSQAAPIHDSVLEAHFAERIACHLKACEAPPEQYTRLGLDPR